MKRKLLLWTFYRFYNLSDLAGWFEDRFERLGSWFHRKAFPYEPECSEIDSIFLEQGERLNKLVSKSIHISRNAYWGVVADQDFPAPPSKEYGHSGGRSQDFGC